MANTLPTATSSGNQNSTQSPQSATNAATGVPLSAVQPTTSSATLDKGGPSTQGVNLTPPVLPSIKLGSQATTARTAPAPIAHHANPVLIGLTVVLFLVAVVLFWSTTRSAKNTTY